MFSFSRKWLVRFTACLIAVMLFSGCENRTIEGTIERPVIHESATVPTNAVPGSLAWRAEVVASNLRFTSVPLANGEVLAVEESRLKQLVAEYNREFPKKCSDFLSHYPSGCAVSAIADGWGDFKCKIILNTIYGQKSTVTNPLAHGVVGLSGGSDISTKQNTNTTPFLFAAVDAKGHFQLTLPRNGAWVFFIVADARNERCYWFKQQNFLFGKTIKVSAADKVGSKHQDPDNFEEITFNTKSDFFRTVLREKYSLLDPGLLSALAYSPIPVRTNSKQEQAAETRSNLEVQAFQRANILFNAHEYENASSAYHDFIRDYTLSPRVPIVKQRLQDVDRILAYQKAAAVAQAQTQQVAQAAAVAQAQADARLRAGYQTQAPAQNNSAFSTTGTVKGTGNSRGDAYAAARQQLPAGAEEISTVYNSTGGSDAAGVNWTPKHYYCKITYRTH